MSILQRIRSDLDRGLLEHRAKVLLEVIRKRIGELTLGELREILVSKLGEGLAALKLVELTGGTGSAPALPGAAQAKPAKAGKKAGKKATAKAAKAPAKAPAKAKAKAKAKRKLGTFGAELLEKVMQTLRAAGVPMTSGELRAALGGSKATMYRAVRELVSSGRVATAGKPARYSMKAEAAAPAPANVATPEAEQPASGRKAAKKAGKKTAAAKQAGGKKAAKKSGGKKAAKKAAAKPAAAKPAAAKGEGVSARTIEGRAQYDDNLIAALRAAGDWVGATRLREAIGGTDNQVRIALHRLIGEGKVVRRGARNATEYRLGG